MSSPVYRHTLDIQERHEASPSEQRRIVYWLENSDLTCWRIGRILHFHVRVVIAIRDAAGLRDRYENPDPD